MSTIDPARRAVVRLKKEGVDAKGNAILDRYTYGGKVLTGQPSFHALKMMLRTYGFEIVRSSDWAALMRDNPEMRTSGDYRASRRVTLLCTSSTVGS